MQNKLIFILILFFSCNRLPYSQGENNDIIVLCSIEDKKLIDFKIDDNFSDYINTPIEENLYNVLWVKPSNFQKYKYYKNILILSLAEPEDSTIDFLYSKINKQYNDKNIFSLYNLYSENQIIMPIGSHNSISFLNLFESNKDWINKEINKNIELNFLKNLLIKSKNDTIMSLLNKKFNINAHIDLDYKIIDNNRDFLRIGRGTPYRWLVFSKIKNNNNNNVWMIFENIIEKHIEGLNISNYYRINDGEFFRGLYEHNESDTGGPLFIYLFDNNINNEVILISGFVNNPGKKKYNILKELEIITKNIRSIENES